MREEGHEQRPAAPQAATARPVWYEFRLQGSVAVAKRQPGVPAGVIRRVIFIFGVEIRLKPVNSRFFIIRRRIWPNLTYFCSEYGQTPKNLIFNLLRISAFLCS
jgi:hypothetical protein